jgi:hypothetical protein
MLASQPEGVYLSKTQSNLAHMHRYFDQIAGSLN